MHLGATAAVGVMIYKLIKTRAVRERPYITHSAIHCVSVPLDRYSFPSGHTLHAVSFTLMVASYFPEWAGAGRGRSRSWSRCRASCSGLHYPTDVAAGALLGGGLAMLSLTLGRALLG